MGPNPIKLVPTAGSINWSYGIPLCCLPSGTAPDVGGNIPDETQVVSIAIYEQVEMLNFQAAEQLSTGLLVFSFLVLVMVYSINRQWGRGLKA